MSTGPNQPAAQRTGTTTRKIKWQGDERGSRWRKITQPIHWTWLWASRKVTLYRRHTQGRSLQNRFQASDSREGKGRVTGKTSPRAGAHGAWCQQAPGCALQPGRANPAVEFSDCTLQLLLDALQPRGRSVGGGRERAAECPGVRPALGNSSRKVISLWNKGLINSLPIISQARRTSELKTGSTVGNFICAKTTVISAADILIPSFSLLPSQLLSLNWHYSSALSTGSLGVIIYSVMVYNKETDIRKLLFQEWNGPAQWQTCGCSQSQ